MGSGEEDPADADGDDGEPDVPSVADLAEDLGIDVDPTTERASGADSAAGDESADGDDPAEPTSFADLLARIRDRRRDATGSTAPDDGLPPTAAGTESDRASTQGHADEGAGAIDWGWGTANDDPPATERAGTSDDESIPDFVDEADSVLLLGALDSPAEQAVCTALLGADPPANLVLVTLTQPPGERLAVCRRALGALPGRTAIVDVGDSARSAGRVGGAGADDDSVTVDSVADPTDLMRMGITISQRLADFEEGDAPTALCFHSLTALHQFVDDQRALFRFVHILRGRVRAAGARAHFHLDPDAHEDEVVALFRPLFDATVRVDDDGSLSVR